MRLADAFRPRYSSIRWGLIGPKAGHNPTFRYRLGLQADAPLWRLCD